MMQKFFQTLMMHKVFQTVFWIIALGSLASFVGHAISQIQSGRGLEYYFTGVGNKMNAIGALIAVGCVLLAALGGLLLRWWDAREERDFKRKYGIQ